jgi:glycosyltransferase involved in cell wall biosynthesis
MALGATPGRTSVVPYGVDVERFRPDRDARRRKRAMLHLADDVPVVFAFGRLVEKKGFAYLIDALVPLSRSFPSVQLILAGEGDLLADLSARAKAAGVGDRVQFVGVVPQHEIPTWLAAADIAVVPSVRDDAGNVDGLPNTVLEIMASGTPLVATRAGGIASVAADGINARLVPERDPRGLAEALTDLLRQPAHAAGLGQEARKLVCQKYNWGQMAESFEAIYQHVSRHDGYTC